MQCPDCGCQHIRKNGHRRGKQNYICLACSHQFIKPSHPQRYSNDVKRLCLRIYVNGMSIRGIDRVRGITHPTIINWIKHTGERLPDAYDPDQLPQVGELDELETFVGYKKNKVWLWTAVDYFCPGILGWVVGNHSANTFQPLWQAIAFWQCYFWVTDSNRVYPCFVPDGDQIVSKTYITWVEVENTRLRHYLARLYSKTLCYSKCIEMLKHSIRLLIHYLKFGEVPIPA